MDVQKSNEIWFEGTGDNWFAGLPVGNGRLGAMVYGALDRMVISVNEETFWSPGPTERAFDGASAATARVRRQLRDGDVLGAQASAVAMMGAPVLGAALQPVGEIVVRTDTAGAPSRCTRRLKMSTGVVTFRWEWPDGSHLERDIVATRSPSVIVMRQRSSGVESVTTVEATSLFADAPIEVIGCAAVLAGQWREVHPNRSLAADSYRLRDRGTDRRLRFALGIDARPRTSTGAGSTHRDGPLGGGVIGLGRIPLGSHGSVVITAATDFVDVDADPTDAVAALLDSAAAFESDELFDSAAADSHEVFGRASIELLDHDVDGAGRGLAARPTDRRVHAVRAGAVDDGLTLLLADFGRYLQIASSVGGSTPPTLQGIWNEDTEPAWSSDWTININLQMALWSADTFGVVEVADLLRKFLEERAVAGRRTAQQVYGARGWVLHHNTDIWRTTAPVTLVEVGIFPAGGLWMLQQLWDHHRFFPDRQTPAELFPLLEGALAFVEDWLVDDADGMLVTSPSSTPENAYLLGDTPRPLSRAIDPEYWRHGWLGESPVLDVWLVTDTLRNGIDTARQLGRNSLAERWEAMLARLRPVSFVDGRIPEWTFEHRPLELGHRHLSRLYTAYPGQADLDAESELRRAVITTLLDHQSEATSSSNGWGGWSRIWAAAIWARLGDGDRALASVERILQTSVAPASLLHAFPEFDGMPSADAVHQSDANMGVPAVISELVLQSHGDVIRPLPALPARWRHGRAVGLRARGGVRVDLEWRDGSLTELVLTSDTDEDVRVKLSAFETRSISLRAGCPTPIDLDQAKDGVSG